MRRNTSLSCSFSLYYDKLLEHHCLTSLSCGKKQQECLIPFKALKTFMLLAEDFQPIGSFFKVVWGGKKKRERWKSLGWSNNNNMTFTLCSALFSWSSVKRERQSIAPGKQMFSQNSLNLKDRFTTFQVWQEHWFIYCGYFSSEKWPSNYNYSFQIC